MLNILSSLLEIIFPSVCLACGKPSEPDRGPLLCKICLSQVKTVGEPLCKCCGKEFQRQTGENHLCGICLTHGFHFDMARAFVQYKPPITTIITRFKYHGKISGLDSLQAIKTQLLTTPGLAQPDLIIPVPLHRRRLRQRGFNQALILARIFYPDQRHLINYSVLERSRHTAPQTGLSGKDRRRNLKNAFLVKEPGVVAGKRVLLVDDVFTTGTTVSECARILKIAGAREVNVLTLARVD